MMKTILNLLFLVPFVSGCVLATRDQMDYLSHDIRQLRSALSNVDTGITEVKSEQSDVQISQADVINQMQELSSELTGVLSHFEDQRTRISLLSSRMDDLEEVVVSRLDLLTELMTTSELAKTPKPSTIMRLARQDYQRGRMLQAEKNFLLFVKRFPKAEAAGEARFFLGEIAFNNGQFGKAVDQYDILLTSHSLSGFVPTAYYRKAMSLEELDQQDFAIDIYRLIKKKYPGRKESRMARSRLDILEEDESPVKE